MHPHIESTWTVSNTVITKLFAHFLFKTQSGLSSHQGKKSHVRNGYGEKKKIVKTDRMRTKCTNWNYSPVAFIFIVHSLDFKLNALYNNLIFLRFFFILPSTFCSCSILFIWFQNRMRNIAIVARNQDLSRKKTPKSKWEAGVEWKENHDNILSSTNSL